MARTPSSRIYHLVALAVHKAYQRQAPNYVDMMKACATVEDQVKANALYADLNVKNVAVFRDLANSVGDALDRSPDFDRARFLKDCGFPE